MIDYKKLKGLRAYHGYSQRAVEKKTSIPIGTLSGKEKGYLRLDLQECNDLAVLYQMTPQDFNEIFLGGKLKDEY
jgi:transcriptional regulator with XRE-family HTH domain